MHPLEVRLTGIQRRNRAAFVPRSQLSAGAELTVGQSVVVRDEHGEFFAGTVVDVDDEERYLVHLGVRLPEEYAMLRLGRQQPRSEEGHQQMQEVLDLLGDARETLAGTLPAQRRIR